MLRIGRSFAGGTDVTTDCSLRCLIVRSQWRLWWARNIQGYAKATANLEVDSSGKVKIRLDPRVEALKDKLIYSDYIDRKRLKYGYAVNKAIEAELVSKERWRLFWAQVEAPTYSVALKYLRSDEGKSEEKEVEEPVREEKRERPIHMPYASIDHYELKETEAPGDEGPEPLLNTKYQKLYEKYLDAKEATNIAPRLKRRMESLERLVEEAEAKEPGGKSRSTEIKRPKDSLENVPPNWMTDYEQYDDEEDETSWELNYGTPDRNTPISNVPCGGCGALLHCQDSALPGYLPSELFKNLKSDDDLKNTICQRCHFMKNYNVTLEVKVSAEAYPEILSQIQLKKRKAAVILMIDLTDFPCSIWPDLPSIIGKYTPIFVVGNKVDLLPKDCSRFVDNVKASLMKALREAGIREFNIKHVELISAQTGYGVERLINKLHKIWAYKGDVYMIGCTNVGKSTLFNALLQSDYCKVQAVDLIQRATTSPWPGTTLNLLKFPILNPVRWRLALRAQRLMAEVAEEQAELQFRKRQTTAERNISFATLQERIGRTFPLRTSLIGPALTAYERRLATGRKFGINENDDTFIRSRWCYDTPGVVHPDQILHLLTTEELLLTLSTEIISPRSFIFKPGQTLFLAGLGRLDLLTGPEFIRITVFASASLPVTICETKDADDIYNELLHTDALAVPINDPERLKIWPRFEYKDFSAQGVSKDVSTCDVLLSSAGWISITPNRDEDVTLRAGTPEGRGIYQRTPALLSNSVSLRGARIKSTAAYRVGRQVYTKP
ncbi:nitric oxide-associated protein 1 [Diachasma alloeum]|uniref:nitric oxide-associated protein 1 n=1 Tax=Diachasma alloeum TaxID=454923 RepID=UPI0007383F14|nr:nitric oxide-associated protein 1 [Diachasma alloeum]